MSVDLIASVAAAVTGRAPEAASRAFFEAVRPLGPSYLQTRVYRRPLAALTSESHWSAGGVVLRLCPEDWPGSAAFNYICFDRNPLLAPIRAGQTLYRFSDFAPKDAPAFADYWDALGEAGVGEALCATAYGPDRRIASLHLGFPSADLGPEDSFALQLAGALLVERLLRTAEPPPEETVALTPREQDALRHAAEGRSDPEIAARLGVSDRTARFHLDNARRKLGAATRTEAVAKFVLAGLL